VRTPVGLRNGGLSKVHPADLGAHAITALVDRTGIDPALVEDVIMGCVSQVGEQGGNAGRNAALAAGFPTKAIEHLSGHSMRVGAAQDLIVSGLGVLSIMQAGGWKTMNVVGRYVENANLASLLQRAREAGATSPRRSPLERNPSKPIQ
jgi:acetyl-CoA acetyltransferase